VTVIVESREDLTLDNYRRVAFDGEGVEVSEAALKRMADARESFFAMLEADPSIFVYGVTSGYGMNAKRHITVDRRNRRNRAPQTHGGAAFGGAVLPERVVRGIIFARLASFIEGNGIARPQLAQGLAKMLERRLPRIPRDGTTWAGEIVPLGHLADALPLELEIGESLLNGSPCAAALVADIAVQAGERLALAERVFCLSIEAIAAPLGAYDPDLIRLWGDPFEAVALRNFNRLLRGVPKKGRRFYQAPVSWEVVVRVIGQAHRAIKTLHEVATASLSSVTQNPVYELPSSEHPLGRAFSNGGYHNASAAPAIDMINASWADLCTIANTHIQKMRRPNVSLLPEGMLHPGDEGGYGMGLLGLGQIHFVEQARTAALRTFLPGAEGDAQDDVAAPAFLAYEKGATAGACLDATLAVLAVVASQALSITNRNAPPALQEFLETVRSHCPPIRLQGRRRALGRELDNLRAAFTTAVLDGDPDLKHGASA
jgi:histidine ammonia-lyase